MKSARTWCVAVASVFFVSASRLPPGRAQDAQEQQGQGRGGTRNPNGGRGGSLFSRQGSGGPLGQGFQFQPGGPGQLFQYGIGTDGGRWFVGSASPPDLDLAPADDSLRELLNLPKNQGVVVIRINPRSSAAAAGIHQNDVLLSLGDSPLAQPKDLYDQLKKADEKPAPLVLLREGNRMTLQVRPVVRVTLGPTTATPTPREYFLGISVTAIEPVLRAQLRLSQPHAVIVNQVMPDSPAAKAGIALHDIIVSFDGKPIVDPGELAQMVQATGGKPIVVELIGKGGKPRSVTVTPGRKKLETSQAQPGGQPNPLAEYRSPVFNYDVVLPGAIVGDHPPERPYPVLSDVYNLELLPNEIPLARRDLKSNSAAKPQDGSLDLTKRLDTLDSDLKELRKLVEDLQKNRSRDPRAAEERGRFAGGCKGELTSSPRSFSALAAAALSGHDTGPGRSTTASPAF